MLEANSKKAFTLIELSLVLVIIGLVVGGVLVGQDLIKSATIRAQVTQIQDLETQLNTFKLKYNCLPGDCTTATDIFGASHAGVTIYNGDGNGIILSQAAAYIAGAATCLTAHTGNEVTQLFLHLKLSGLSSFSGTGVFGALGAVGSIVVVGTDLPMVKVNSTGLLVSCINTHVPGNGFGPTPVMFNSGNSILLGFGNLFNTGRLIYRAGRWNGASNITGSGIPPDSARIIDEKIDDGAPDKGTVGVLFDCSGTIGASSYTALANTCMITIARNLK